MSHAWPSFLRWTPRVLGLLFALFLSLFSFDVLDLGLGFWSTLGAFLIHSLPTFALLAAVALGWRRPLAGGLIFAAWGIFYLIAMRGEHWSALLLVGALPLLIGLLFIADHFLHPPAPHAPPGPIATT